MPFFAGLSISFCITSSVYACISASFISASVSFRHPILLPFSLTISLPFYLLRFYLSISPSFLSTFLLGTVFLLFLVKLAFTHIVHYIRLNYIDDIYPFLSRTAPARFAANCIDSSGWISFLRRLSHRSSQNQMGRRQHGRCTCRIHVLLCSSA